MGHRVIIINSTTPSAESASAIEPEFKVSVEYRPADALTSSQIGNEVARIQRKVNQIIEGGVD